MPKLISRDVPCSRRCLALAALAAAGLTPTVAFAHHLMGGKIPASAFDGLLSGLVHPIIGLDHFAFIIGAGIVAGISECRLMAPLGMIAGSLAGAGLHLCGLDIGFSEIAVAVSVAFAGSLVFSRRPVDLVYLVIAFFVAGLFHGYAYAESIVGAETTPLLTYLLGFGFIQYAIAAASGYMYEWLVGHEEKQARKLAKISGGLMSIFGIVLVVRLVTGS